MTNPFGPHTELMERLETIADALVPVLRAFRDELGETRANEIAARGLSEWRYQLALRTTERVVGSPRDCWEKVAADTFESAKGNVEVSELAEDRDGIRFYVTGCRLAEFFRSIGEAELGYELACAHDFAQVEALAGDDVQLERPETLMEGGRRCDFYYRFARSAGAK